MNDTMIPTADKKTVAIKIVTVFFSHIFFHSAPDEGFYCKPKYRAILFEII